MRAVAIAFAIALQSSAMFIAPACAQHASASIDTLASATEVALAVSVNGEPREAALMLQDAQGKLYAPRSAVEGWGLTLRSTPIKFKGQSWIALDGLQGVRYRIEMKEARLLIDADPAAMRGRTLGLKGRQHGSATPSQPGGFLNYSVLAESGVDARFGSLLELGAFAGKGIVLSSFSYNSEQLQGPGAPQRFARLDTSMRVDDQQTMRTWTIGDSINRAGSWGRAVRFAGVQYGSNFSTQPQFTTAPFLSGSGVAAVPSVVDIYVNRQLVGREQVPAGPFSIENIAPITGAGEVSVVVRDPLGREQVLSNSFYSSADLLREGLQDFSFEAGVLRTSYGIDMGHYAGLVASGTWRRGISDRLTAEVHGETGEGVAALGSSVDWLWRGAGVLSAGVAASHADEGVGALAFIGLEHLGRVSLSARSYFATDKFRQLGTYAPMQSLQRLSFANLSFQLGHIGSIGLAWVAQRYRGMDPIDVGSLSYSMPLTSRAFLSLTASRTVSTTDSTSVFAAISIPFGGRSVAATSAQWDKSEGQPSRHNYAVTMQQSLPTGEGWGYRLYADSRQRNQAAGSYQGRAGLYTLEAASTRDDSAMRAQVDGSVGVLAGHVFASRQLNESFALVHTGDYPNVRIYADHQYVGTSDADGYAVVPRLRAYDENRLSIDLKNLPIEARAYAVRDVATPYYRGGTLVEFPLRRERGVTFSIALPTNEKIPAGSRAYLTGRDEPLMVGYGGLVYLTNPPARVAGEVEWLGRRCSFSIDAPPSKEPLPDLGTAICGDWQ